MSVQNSDLLLVQRGNVPYRSTAEELSTKIRGDIDVSSPSGDIPVASASQLGVIRVGNNLSIDANGVLEAVVPAGLSYEGVWTDTDNPPTATQSGQFWIWDGGDGSILDNALWGTANTETVNNGDRIFYDATTFEVVPGGGGGGGVQTVTGTAPISIGGDAENPDVSITAASASSDGSMSKEHWSKLEGIQGGAEVNVDPSQTYTAAADGGTLTLSPGSDTTAIPVATTTEAGLMSGADKTILDNLTASPGGVLSVTGGDDITISGTAGAPVVNVTANSFIPYDLNDLGELV